MAVVYQIACHASTIHHQMHSVSCTTQLPFPSIKLTRFLWNSTVLFTPPLSLSYTHYTGKSKQSWNWPLTYFFGGCWSEEFGWFHKKNTLQTGFEWKKLLYGTSSNILTPKKAGKKAIIVVVLKNNIYL